MSWRSSLFALLILALAAPAWPHRAEEHDAEEMTPYAVPEPGSYTLPALGVAANGQILAADGSETTLHDVLAGRLVVLSFIYTNCGEADGCPLATAVLHRLQRRVAQHPALAAHTKIVSLSFDPVRDTPAVMNRYGKSFQHDAVPWVFLTTSGEQTLSPILASFGHHVHETWIPDRAKLSNLSHLLRVFLIDASGRIRNIYGASTLDADFLRADLETLHLERAQMGRGEDGSEVE